ncbi:MAG: aminotransferase class V-fold PLP-dependent enzyme [Peptococcaceae bacterium]
MCYFDNAATTFPKPEQVYTFMDRFYRDYGVNVGRGQHKLAFTASMLVNETRNLLLELFHCSNKKVVFTHTATEALNIILQGLPVNDNFNVYLTPYEHNAVTRVIHHMQSKYKLNIYNLAVDKTSQSYDLETIQYQFADKRPNIVVMTHASNVCGLVSPIQDICRLSKKHGAINIVDMSQTAGLIDTDLSNTSIDFAVFAGHKTLYGPLGVAGFICGNDLKPLPLLFGGTGVDSANQGLPENIPERYEVASPNIMAIAGLNSALKWINTTGINNIYLTEKANHRLLLEVLNGFNNIEIVGPTSLDNTIGVVSCVFDGYSSDNIGQILSEQNIAVRTGLHCAPFAHNFLGTFPAGTVRFSVGYFNDKSDFEKLREVLAYINENS